MIFVTEKNEIDTWVEVPKFTKLDTIVAKLITLYRMNIEFRGKSLLHTSIAIAKHTVTWRYPCRANRDSFDSIAIKTKRVTNVRDLGSQNKTTTELLGFFSWQIGQMEERKRSESIYGALCNSPGLRQNRDRDIRGILEILGWDQNMLTYQVEEICREYKRHPSTVSSSLDLCILDFKRWVQFKPWAKWWMQRTKLSPEWKPFSYVTSLNPTAN